MSSAPALLREIRSSTSPMDKGTCWYWVIWVATGGCSRSSWLRTSVTSQNQRRRCQRAVNVARVWLVSVSIQRSPLFCRPHIRTRSNLARISIYQDISEDGSKRRGGHGYLIGETRRFRVHLLRWDRSSPPRQFHFPNRRCHVHGIILDSESVIVQLRGQY